MNLLSLFRRPEYRSDVSVFLGQLKQDRPHIESAQQAGRARLWEPVHQANKALRTDFASARVAQTPYVYLTRPKMPAKQSS